ncbi:MAG: cache domain-containing protein [Proteobacteria bacterium]|nr:cache domain-containing protein [Pseudomonadota bacterium]
MKNFFLVLLASFFFCSLLTDSLAEQKVVQGTKEEARAMIENAAVWFQKYGKEKTLTEITLAGSEKKGEFINHDLYIFAYDFNGVVLAHGANPKLVGKNLYDFQDADGRYLIRGLIDTAQKGSGWYYYKWSNPISKKIEDKMAYVLKIDDGIWIGAGVYGREVQEKVKVRIGIFKLFDQALYDESLRGIMDQLEEDGLGADTATFMIENAMNSYVKAEELVHKLAMARMDLIVSLGTQASVIVTKAIKDVPVVFSVVYDPVEAGIVEDWEKPGHNATGTSTKIPMENIFNTLKEMAPVNKLAVIYTPGEKNSEAQLSALQAVDQKKLQIKVEPVPVSKKQDLEQILREVVHTSDAIYLTGSSIVNATVPLIVDAAGKEKLITITHLENLVRKGVLVGICADPYLEGRMAGEKIVQILKGAKPSSVPVGIPTKVDIVLNRKTEVGGRFALSPFFINKVTKTID